MALNFDTTTGTGPLSWYPLRNSSAAAATSPPPVAPDTSFLFQPSQSPSLQVAPLMAPIGGNPAVSLSAPSSPFPIASAIGGGLSGLRALAGTPLGDSLGLSGAPSSGLQAASSLLNLIQGVQSGNYSAVPPSLYGLYQGAGGLVNAATGANTVPLVPGGGFNAGNLISALPSVAGLISGKPVDPAAAGVIGGYGQALSAGLLANAAMATGSIPYAAIVAQAISDAMGVANLAQGKESPAQVALGSIPVIGSYAQALQHQLDEDPSSWATIGKASTAMGEGALRGGQQANDLAALAQRAGITDPRVLQSLVGAEGNALFPFYQAISGPVAPITAQAWLDRVTKGAPALAQQYRDTQNTLQNNIWNTISGLYTAGLPTSSILSTPTNPNWGDTYLGGLAVQKARDAQQAAATGTPQTTITANGLPMSAQMLMDPGMAALASGPPPTSIAQANAATGGPTGSMLASLNPALYSQIGGSVAGPTPAEQAALQQEAAMINQTANQNFTSGGM